jgi:hypothetical protein
MVTPDPPDPNLVPRPVYGAPALPPTGTTPPVVVDPPEPVEPEPPEAVDAGPPTWVDAGAADASAVAEPEPQPEPQPEPMVLPAYGVPLLPSE